ncbi:YtxH domain-containing protein [Paraclostridium sordellii]|uniref:YtxH domain-containing protein n=1 Tax=Paraclostridium sordellii TaxID=1505 RepID=UPI0005DDFBAA|nr:YtxH domain-containing protein [Paeniclostridium sordellii]CEN21742.1 Uncharacterised protein [[Clostridium] sordellii] [Paeniclostridium sordellii]
MNNNQMNNQIDDYTNKGKEYIEKTENKANELLSKANDLAHDMVDKTSDISDDVNNLLKKKDQIKIGPNDECSCGISCECFDEPKTTVDYVKDYAKQHPVITATALSATVLTGVSLVSPKTRKITVPVAKYAIKQQAKFSLGLGMLAMASYLTNQHS